MSLNQSLLFILIVVILWLIFTIVIAWLGRPKSRLTKIKTNTTNDKNDLTKAQQEELNKIAYEMSCVFAGKNILQQFLVQVSESLTEQEIITHLANSIKVCNNNDEVKALDLTTSTTTDDYIEHAKVFYETIIKNAKTKITGGKY